MGSIICIYTFEAIPFASNNSLKPFFYLYKVKIPRMKPAPLLFLTAIQLVRLQKGEARFLLVNVDGGEDVRLNVAPGPKRCLNEHDINCSDNNPCCKGLTCHKYRTNLASQCWNESSETTRDKDDLIVADTQKKCFNDKDCSTGDVCLPPVCGPSMCGRPIEHAEPPKQVEYDESLTTKWCKLNKDVEGRNGCMDDKQCLDNARGQCDKDPDCYGVSWYPNKIGQKIKLCLSRDMAPKRDGWRTMMKSEDESVKMHTFIDDSKCEWGPWKMSKCSKTCGGGKRDKHRFRQPKEGHEEAYCGPSVDAKSEDCNTDPCPIDCIWGDWKKGSCSKSCGGGTRTNERIKVVKEEHGGTCEGESTEVEDCNEDKCPLTGVACCKEKGVPKECYGFCINPESSEGRRLDSRSDRPNLCTKYKEIAAECELGYRNGPCATLYEEFYYLGVKLDLDEGEGDIHHNNDKVSSIRVRQGCTLTAYHNMGMTNSMFSLSEDVEVLEDDENDNMSSYRCICDDQEN